MTNLKAIHGLNEYCGPAVLSAITGKSTDECAAVISAITGRDTIKGVAVHDILRAVNKLGYTHVKVEPGRTLYGTMMRLNKDNGFYIITVPKHYVAIEVNNGSVYLIDNHTKAPLLASSSSRMMQVVEGAYKIIEKKLPVFIGSNIRIDLGNDYTDNNGVIHIYSVNRYEDPEDNNQYKLGSIKFKTIEELNSVFDALKFFLERKND